MPYKSWYEKFRDMLEEMEKWITENFKDYIIMIDAPALMKLLKKGEQAGLLTHDDAWEINLLFSDFIKSLDKPLKEIWKAYDDFETIVFRFIDIVEAREDDEETI